MHSNSGGQKNVERDSQGRRLQDLSSAGGFPREQFFQLTQCDPTQFTAMVVQVMIDGKRRFFDPATLYCPFEILPRAETASSAN